MFGILNDKALVMEETTKKRWLKGVTQSIICLTNFNDRRLEREEEQSQEPSSSSAAEGTQLMNDEVNQVVDCIMNHPSSELVNFQSSICDSLPQENVDPKVCTNTSVLGCPGSSANYKDCMEAKVGNTKVKNVFDERLS